MLQNSEKGKWGHSNYHYPYLEKNIKKSEVPEVFSREEALMSETHKKSLKLRDRIQKQCKKAQLGHGGRKKEQMSKDDYLSD